MANLTYYKEEDGETLYLDEEGYVVDCDGCYFPEQECTLMRKTKRLARMIYDMGFFASVLYSGHPRIRFTLNGQCVNVIYYEGDPDYVLVGKSRMTPDEYIEELKKVVPAETK